MQAMKIVLLTLLLLIAPTTDLLAQVKEKDSATYYESGALHFEYSYLKGRRKHIIFYRDCGSGKE